MRRSASPIIFLLLVIPTLTWCQPQGPKAGPEFQVNTYTTNWQSYPQIGVSATGTFVMVWHSWGQDGSKAGIFARRYDSNGAALDPAEIQVNAYTTGSQEYPAVAVGPLGDFVVAWQGQGPGTGTLFGRRFGSSGVPLDPAEFQIDTNTARGSYYPAIAMDTSGTFTVVWQTFFDGDEHVFGRRFDSAGDALEPVAFQVSSPGADNSYPAVGSDSSGDFVVVWSSSGNYSSHILARRFDSAGSPLDAGDIQVESTYAGSFPTLGVAPSGQFVVAWPGIVGGPSGDYYQIIARRFDSTGAPLDPEQFAVSVDTAPIHWSPSVGVGPAGNFVVAWQRGDGPYGSSYRTDIVGRRFTSDGVAVDPVPFQVSTDTATSKYGAGVAVAPSGDFAVVWESYGQDGDDEGIFAQRFSCPDLDGDGICDGEDIIVDEPADGSTVECPARGATGPVPVVSWSPGNYDRFRVAISGDPDFTSGSLVRSSAMLQTATSWTPRTGQWRHACRRLGPDLYIRVYGEDTDISSSDPRYSTFSNVVHVTTTTVMKLPLREGLGGR